MNPNFPDGLLVYTGMRLALTPVLILFFVLAIAPFSLMRIADTALIVAERGLARCLLDARGPFIAISAIIAALATVLAALIVYLHG